MANCKKNINGAKSKMWLVFHRDDLLYDIETYAFVEGDVLPPEFHGAHQISDIAQEGNEDMVTRMFNLAHAECMEALYPYTKAECHPHGILENTLETPKSYYISLDLPEGFSRTTVGLIKELVHNYFVVKVISEWIGMLYPDMRPYWERRLEEIKNRLKTATIPRRNRLRIKQSLF